MAEAVARTGLPVKPLVRPSKPETAPLAPARGPWNHRWMRLAYTMTTGRGELDPLLHDVARTAMARGLRLAGIVQVNSDRPGCARCDMDAVVLPDGPVIRISQSLGRGARGCRLDAAGLETAVAASEARLAQGADLLVVNKFGKQEAAGRGFRPVIAAALDAGADVLVGVNALNLAALHAFTGDVAEALPPTRADLLRWLPRAT